MPLKGNDHLKRRTLELRNSAMFFCCADKTEPYHRKVYFKNVNSERDTDFVYTSGCRDSIKRDIMAATRMRSVREYADDNEIVAEYRLKFPDIGEDWVKSDDDYEVYNKSHSELIAKFRWMFEHSVTGLKTNWMDTTTAVTYLAGLDDDADCSSHRHFCDCSDPTCSKDVHPSSDMLCRNDRTKPYHLDVYHKDSDADFHSFHGNDENAVGGRTDKRCRI